MASVSALLQNAAVASFLPGLTVVGNVQPLPAAHGSAARLPALGWWGPAWSMSLATLACAVGLLIRLELGRVASSSALLVPGHRRSNVAGLGSRGPAAVAGQQHIEPLAVAATGGRRLWRLPSSTAARVMAVLVTVGACLPCWCGSIRRLMSAFGAPQSSPERRRASVRQAAGSVRCAASGPHRILQPRVARFRGGTV